MAASLPTDIIYVILSRLPVKSLLRFKCVCKTWHDFIESSDFIKSHLNSIETNSNFSLILTNSRSAYIYQLHGLNRFSPATKLRLPHGRVLYLTGTCNGLICLILSTENLALLNPSTRRFHLVPGFKDNGAKSDIWSCSFGFGYDGESDDYKIVKLSESYVSVYSLRANSWSQALPPGPSYFTFIENCMLNNHFHWICYKKGLLHSFDLHNNTWERVLTLPNCVRNNCSCWKLGVFNGCLCLSYHGPENPTTFEMWTMKEYGVEELWTKFLSYDKQRGDLLSDMYRHGLFQHTSWKKTTKEVKALSQVWRVGCLNEKIFCMESLVPLMGHDKLQGKEIRRLRKLSRKENDKEIDEFQ